MHIDRIFRGIGSFSVRFRWVILIAWIVAAGGIAHSFPSLASVTQGNNANFLPASAPSEHAATLAAPFGETNVIPVLVLAARTGGPLTSSDQSWLNGLSTDLRAVPTVTGVRDLGQSAGGNAVQMEALSSVSGGNSAALTTLVTDLRSAISKAGPPAGLQVHLAGEIAVAVDQQAQTGDTGNKIQYLSVLFIIVLLLLIFRAILAPLITLLPAFVAITIAGPLVAEAAQAGLKVSQLAQILLIVLVLGAGTDYGLFLVFRVREQLRAGLDPKEAVIVSLTRVGESITFSAATVIAALLSLLVATFQIYSTLGIPLAIGVGVMLLAGLTLLPALLAIFGRAAFWPSKTRAGTGKPGVWGRVAGRIVRHPALILSIGVIAFGALAVASLGYKGAGFGGEVSAPAHTDSAAGQALLSKYFPSSSANPTNIIFKLDQPAWDSTGELQQAAQQLSASGLFTQLTGPLNTAAGPLTPAQFTKLHSELGAPRALPATPPPWLTAPPAEYQAYRATAVYVSPDGRTVQFDTGIRASRGSSVTVDPSSTGAMDAVPGIRAETTKVAHAIGAADSGVGGEAPALYDVSAISDSDLARVIPVAILVIGLLLALVMRSLVAPLYLIASVGLSYLAALGLSVLLFIDIGGSAGLTFILPFLMFIFLLALGEDYNILVMSRIREEARRITLREAVVRSLNATGTTVTSAGLVLAGTFGVFALVGARTPGGSQFIDLAVGLALGILMDTFLVRTLLVPSTVLLLGRWNWWPSRLSSTDHVLAAGAGGEAGVAQAAGSAAAGSAAAGSAAAGSAAAGLPGAGSPAVPQAGMPGSGGS